MSTVNFSVPEDIKVLCNATFAGQNKSAIVADLMREAVERAIRKQRSQEAYARILESRKTPPALRKPNFAQPVSKAVRDSGG